MVNLTWAEVNTPAAKWLRLLGFATELVYISTMEFEWDAKKAKANLRKYRVRFLEASTALRDPLATTGRDPEHSDDEER